VAAAGELGCPQLRPGSKRRSHLGIRPMDVDPVRPAFHLRISGGPRSSATLPQAADLRVALMARQRFAVCQPTTDPAIRNAEGYKLGADQYVGRHRRARLCAIPFANAEPIRGGPLSPALSIRSIGGRCLTGGSFSATAGQQFAARSNLVNDRPETQQTRKQQTRNMSHRPPTACGRWVAMPAMSARTCSARITPATQLKRATDMTTLRGD
jgi:hypothetical protein